jgi:uncharacterized protein
MTRFVRVANTTRQSTLGNKVPLASSLIERAVGLLGTPTFPEGDGLLIERTASIHMFFMRYAIDAVFIGKGNRVTKVVANLKPWRVVLWAWGARDCLELPAGTAERTGTRVGDELEIAPI